MRLLADENVSATVIQALRAQGHDILSARESMRSERDDALLARAQAEKRRRLPANCGIILFRLSGSTPDADNDRILSALASRTDWEGNFSVVSESEIRVRPLPTS